MLAAASNRTLSGIDFREGAPIWSREGGYPHYTRHLAQDLGPFGITVNCTALSVIATERIMATVIPGSDRDRTELVPLRRLGTVEDCANVAGFLATDLSDDVTGAVIPIDGGCAWIAARLQGGR